MMIKQGTKEWFSQRKGMITGSRVGAILGLNPWQTHEDVMRAMVREYHGAPSEFEGNVATEWGNVNEENAIFQLEIDEGIDVEPTGFHVHPIHGWLGASPDGLIDDDAVAEIKCPYGIRNDEKPQFKTAKEQPHYYAQMQIEMACTGRSVCYFYQWTPKGDQLEVVHYDEKWFFGHVQYLEQFYKDYLDAIEAPDKYLDDLVNEIPEHVHADDYKKALSLYNDAKAKLDLAKKELIKLAGGKKSKIGDLLIYPIERQGSIGYAKVVKQHLPDLDLEPYRGKPSTSWGVK